MTASLHEDLSRADQIKGGSDRSFGLTVGGILLLIAIWRSVFHALGWLETGLGVLGVALIAAALAAPAILRPLNRTWTALGLLMAKVVSPIALGLIYALTVVPTGLIMRVLGHDLLRLKLDRAADTYWIKKEPPGPAADTMANQF